MILGGTFIFLGGQPGSMKPSALMVLMMTLGTSIIYSFVIWRHYRRGRPISNGVLVFQLLWDTLLVLAVVGFIGRSTNPFIYYLLVIIAIGASLFRQRIVWMFCGASIMAYSALMYVDFNQHLDHFTSDFRSHLIGMWVNFVGSACLISFFISRLTLALRHRDQSLALAREEILKNEQLIGIGTLAASTVHSMGTPLSTIAMCVGEIEDIHQDIDTAHCTSMIKTQIHRCKRTLAKLSSLVEHDAKHALELQDLIQDIKEHFELTLANPQPQLLTENCDGHVRLPGGLLLKHALINLIDNAVHAARTSVKVTCKSVKEIMQITIEDDGEGIKPELLSQLGEAIVHSPKSGMGIGFLLANSTIERLNGEVSFENPDLTKPSPRTRIVIQLPTIESRAH